MGSRAPVNCLHTQRPVGWKVLAEKRVEHRMRLARQMGPEYKGRETKVGHPRHRVLTG